MAAPQFVLEGSFTALGVSSSVPVAGEFVLTVWGTPLGADGTAASFGGTIQLERSPDAGTTWCPASIDGTGTPAAYSGPAAVVGTEPIISTLYRLRCAAYSSGTINYFFATIPPRASS